jgi:hypothetical protein
MIPTESEIPDSWPATIREHWTEVVREHRAAGNDPAPLLRIANDRRVSNAWEHLRKAGNRYTARDPELVFLAFVRNALTLHLHAPPSISTTELQSKKQHYRKQVDSLRQTIDELNRLGIEAAGAALPKYATALAGLSAGAEYCACHADSLEVAPYMLVGRHRTDPKLRGFIRYMLGASSHLYGQPLYGTVATFASVLFDCPVSDDTVRRVWKSKRRD